MVFVGIDDGELFEGKRVTPRCHQGTGFFIPERFEVAVDFGELGGQGRVDDDFEVVPGQRLATGSVPLGTDPNGTSFGVRHWQKGGV